MNNPPRSRSNFVLPRLLVSRLFCIKFLCADPYFRRRLHALPFRNCSVQKLQTAMEDYRSFTTSSTEQCLDTFIKYGEAVSEVGLSLMSLSPSYTRQMTHSRRSRLALQESHSMYVALFTNVSIARLPLTSAPSS